MSGGADVMGKDVVQLVRGCLQKGGSAHGLGERMGGGEAH